MSKICYTAIFGPYDDLKEPKVITPGWRYICYTDQDLKSNVWEIVKQDVLPEGPQVTARFYKIVAYSAAQSIWVDASFIISCNLDEFWNRYFKPPFSAPQHPLRNCVYQEAEACIRNKRAPEQSVADHIAKYVGIIPANNGMISSGILMRNDHPGVRMFCDKWWMELFNNSVRDQISFAKIDFDYPHFVNRFQWDYTNNTDFIFTTHLHNRNKGYIIRRRKRRIVRRRVTRNNIR